MNNKYSTQDFPLAVSLVANSFVIESIELDKSSYRATFYFNYSEELVKVIEQFWAQNLFIEAQRFFQSYKMTKNRLNEIKRESSFNQK